jgi:four helix bundle protein
MSVTSYQDLLVWQKAMNYVEICYSLTKDFPQKETFGLSSQLQRSAVSIPSNIAEGQGRISRGEFIHFPGIAQGSLRESETQIILAHRLKYISDEQLNVALSLSKEVGILLGRLIRSLRNKT